MFTLPWVILVALVSALCLVLFSSLSDNTLVDTPAPRPPFAQLTSLAHQFRSVGENLRISGPPVVKVVQDVLSGAEGPQSDPDTGRILDQFNFGVGTRGVGEGREVEG